MASKKLKYSDIAEQNLFAPLIEEIKQIDSLLGKTADSLKAFAKESAELANSTPMDGYANLEKKEKAIRATTKSVEELSKIEEQRSKLDKRIISLTNEQAKSNELLKVQIQERTKALKEEAKLNSESIGPYAKASDRLTKLRKTYKDLAIQNKENTEEGKALLKTIQDLDKNLKELDDRVGENQRTVGKYGSGIRATTESVEKLSKAEKERIRLEERLASLNDEQAKANALLKVEIQERTKALKEEAKLNSDAIGAYAKASARLTKMRKAYKDLAIQNKENTEEGRALLKTIQELDNDLKELDDRVGQNQRSVGKYEKALQGLGKKMQAVGKATGIIAILAGTITALGSAFNSNQGSADAMAKVIARVTVTVQVFINRLVGAAGNLSAVFEGIQLSVQAFFLDIERGFAKLPAVLGGSAAALADVDKRIADLQQRQAALTAGGQGSIASVQASFQGMGKEIQDKLKLYDQLVDKTTAYRNANTRLIQNLAELQRQQALLQQQADDDTTSLEDQQKATEDLRVKNQEVADAQLRLANQEVELARLKMQIDSGSLVAKEEYAAAVVASIEAQAEAELVAAENETKRQQIIRDNMELDLDQLIDIADRRKTINEAQASDERLAFDKRQSALEEATSGIEESFRKQAEVLQNARGVFFNIDDLINEEDTIKLNERIKALGLNEIEQNRLREIIQDRIQATEDLRVANDDLTESESEARGIRADILAQEKALAEIEKGSIPAKMLLEKLEKRRLELQKENLQLRIAELDKTSVERLRLEQELNNLLLEDIQERADKEVGIEAEKQKRIEELAKEAFGILSDLSDEYFERRKEKIEEDIEASKKREDELRELAIQGNQSATESLAVEQQRQAELELQRQQQIKRQKLAELALAAIEVYSSKVSSGDASPLASTIADVSVLRAFVEALPPFFEGAERVGDEIPATIAGRDGHVIRVDGDERILSPAQNAMIPRNMSNIELANLARKKEIGERVDTEADFSRIERKLQEVVNAIEGQETYKGMDFDAHRAAVTFHIEQRGKITRKHRKIKNVFG